VAYHYKFTFGVNKANKNKEYTFTVSKGYDGAYLLIDGEQVAEGTWMKEGEKLYS
jgi:hypothetical protein